MSIKQFIVAIEKYGLRFVMVGERRIRTKCGMCPIEALAHVKGYRAEWLTSDVSFMAKQLGLSDKSTLTIVMAADYTYRGARNRKDAPAAREIRRSLRAFTEKA